MEAVGAVASLIAVGQAVAALPKIIHFFRALPEMNDELASLINEVRVFLPICVNAAFTKAWFSSMPSNSAINHPLLLFRDWR